MISTLIRTAKGKNPPPQGTSEYLVNTENNKVIYPYTLAENILSKDINGDIILPGDFNKPIFGGGGIDPSGFRTERFNIGGIRIPAKDSNVSINAYSPPEIDDGIYIIWVEIYYRLTPAPASNGRYKSLYIATPLNTLQSIYIVETYSGYAAYSGSMIGGLRKTDQINVVLGNSIDSSARSLASDSYIIYRMIRICDLPT